MPFAYHDKYSPDDRQDDTSELRERLQKHFVILHLPDRRWRKIYLRDFPSDSMQKDVSLTDRIQIQVERNADATYLKEQKTMLYLL